jgi:putative SOS response-associated peptidase YedK
LDDAGRKSPFFIHLADQKVFTFAALITMPGNELMRRVHNTGANLFRMPAILAQADQDAWLNGTKDEAQAVLQQYPD